MQTVVFTGRLAADPQISDDFGKAVFGSWSNVASTTLATGGGRFTAFDRRLIAAAAARGQVEDGIGGRTSGRP